MWITVVVTVMMTHSNAQMRQQPPANFIYEYVQNHIIINYKNRAEENNNKEEKVMGKKF